MNTPDLPDDLRDFIGRYILSVEKMEILLLLSKDSAKTWTTELVFKQIQSNNSSIERWLKELCDEGFLEQPSSQPSAYRYAPAQPGLAPSVDALAHAYQDRPVRVIEAIFSKSNRQLHHFAEAFRLRKRI